MQPERWRQVKALFAAALEREPAERQAFLERTCDDAAIRAEVASLLEAHDESDGFIERPAVERAGLAAQTWIGRRLGAWRITGEIGRGGMSRVYKAVRDDGQYEKEAAIKLLRPGLDSDSLLRRFRAERQILARLSHPNIAQLLDGGATEDGAPYLVMEYVAGQPIDAYCDAHHLGVEQRLDLFRSLCGAVHYVHQHLMVHGDLKGGNVLVTDAGVVKLLDFGIAKLLGPDVAGEEAPATGFVALTPEYASPEQVRGEPITTASDVYSLGVLLYRLLTGELPYKVENGSSWKLATQILEQDPAPPSSTAEQGGPQHRKFVRAPTGDLDNIVLKALRKQPEERYASAEQLSEDLRRYLRGFPVQARPDTTTYRIRKFAQRHRSAVAASALFLVSLIGGVVATTWQAYVASRERARAERHFNEVRELSTVYMADVYDAVARLPGGTAARKLLVENSLKYLAALEREAGDSPEVLRDLALAYERLAEVQGDYLGASAGDTQAAVQSYRRALDLRRALVELEQTAEARRAWLRSHVTLSEMLAGQAGQTRTEEALEIARAGAQIADELLSARTVSDEDRWQARGAYLNYGWQLGMLGRVDEGLPFMLKAQTLAEEFATARPDDPRAQRDLAVVAGRIGNVYMEGLGRPEEALPWYERTASILEPLAAANPLDAELQRASAFALATIGEIQNGLGRPKEALVNHETALARLRKLRDADPEDNFTPLAVVYGLNHLSDSQMQLGEYDAALRSLSEADAILRSLPPAGPDDLTDIRALPGVTAHRFARVHAQLAQKRSLPAHVRANHDRLSREWATRARDVLTPLASDAVIGKRVRELLDELP